MNSKRHILTVTLLILMSGGCFQSCQQDDDILTAMPTDRASLIAQGRYLTARDASTFAMGDITDKPEPFDEGTPYRLLAFARPYDANNPNNETSDPQNGENTDNPQSGENTDNPPSTTITPTPRFNKVAWEGKSDDGIRFINLYEDPDVVNDEPDVMFGFSALGSETPGGDDGLVSLDFYGFTYGKPQDITHPSNYIELMSTNGTLEGETTPTNGSMLSSLYKTETVSTTDNQLNDLMWGCLLNQNITTAGADNDSTQSVIPFKHCFSKLRFQVSQQSDENGEEVFKSLKLVSIKVTNTYKSGKVYLEDGKVEVTEPVTRLLSVNGNVGINDADVGEMLIFPSHHTALKNSDLSDGYKVGLEITVKSTVKQDIFNMLRNTSSSDVSDEAIEAAITTPSDADGNVWYQGTITKTDIKDYYSATPKTLYFKQNTSYMLIVAFHKTDVRIITVIPMVEEWLPGEGSLKDPWEYLDIGQPQLFDNVVWSDRNLGADHFDPTSGDYYEHSMGYFYQGGRNIPYYPFENHWSYYDPDFSTMNSLGVADHKTDWHDTDYQLFPIVDPEIRNMEVKEVRTNNGEETTVTYKPGNWTYWNGGQAQMMIPEQKPTDTNFNFCSGLGANNDMNWDKGQQNQPISGAWVVPTMQDFLTIFPSTPHAGNIVFNKIGDKTKPGDWGYASNFQMSEDDVPVLRVTVPYYKDGSTEADRPTYKSAKYVEAWNTLFTHDDDGTTHIDKYEGAGKPDNYVNRQYEPDGDPEDGYASVYIISRAGDDKVVLPEKYANTGRFVVKSWGTIYAIKRVYTHEAYRMRWRAIPTIKEAEKNPRIYIEICRFRCKPTDTLTEENYTTYDWDHPVARIYFPVCGMGDWDGAFINFGIECVYATSDPIIDGHDGKYYMNAVQIKITGNNATNAFISVVKGASNRLFGMQIRPVGGGY